MEIVQELLPGVFVLSSPKYQDNRGWLTVPFEFSEFSDLVGTDFDIWQTMMAHSRMGVIRGLHYQIKPFWVAKIVSCVRGVVYDVVVDLRPRSASYGAWACLQLSEADNQSIYIPPGFAHGYTSLTDISEVIYYQDGEYVPGASRILAWDDPDLNIRWPMDNPILSKRDRTQGVSFAEYKIDPEF